ncbi:hypothetical protein, partial [Methanothermobacter sp.]|uniref:hypothetical protein n=1 Tax=Methanothermobacter sp. TaxID=1884223 RepID=UPI002605D6A1
MSKYFYLVLVFVLFTLTGSTYALDDENSSKILVYGTVYDCKNSTETISGANITLSTAEGKVITGITDMDGKYILNAPLTKNFTVRANYKGHLECVKFIEVNDERYLNVDLTLGQPEVTVTGPSESLINENFQLTFGFDNNGTTPGFGPIVEVTLPPEVTLQGMTYMGFSVNYFDLGTFPGSGQILNPLTRNITTGTPGYRLIVIEYPFGSFTPEQPVAEVLANFKLAINSTLGLPLNITATPIFRFGNDPLDNPSTDPPIYGATVIHQVTPTVFRVKKRVILHEDETATGPNYPFNYIIDVDVANGATVSNINITDILPSNIQFLQIINSADASIVETPSTSTPGGTLKFKFDSITGVTGIDRTLVFRVYAPEFDNSRVYVIDPDTGAPVTSKNIVMANGTYNDTYVTSISTYTVYLRSLAVQKYVRDINAGYVRPGDILEYRIDFQISDYFEIKDLIFADIISDGQSFDTSFTPILNIIIAGNTYSLAFSPTNYIVSHDPSTGKWTIIFNVSGQLNDAGIGGILPGGLYYDRNHNLGATMGNITFRSIIDITFEDTANYPPGNPFLKSGDSVSNTVSGLSKLSHNGHPVSESSGASVTISQPSIEKIVYAINGLTPVSPYRVRPGDNVTFSLRVIVPTTNIENFTMCDFLPIPFFRATQISTNIPQGDAPPAAGEWRLASDDTLSSFLGRLPTVNIDPLQNIVHFFYGTVNSTDQQTRVSHILFTVTATDEPFADELYLTNQFAIKYYNSPLDAFCQSDLAQVITQEPRLTINKTITSTTGHGIIDPEGNLIGADAGDTITYKILIENTGSWNAYNVTVRDIIPVKLINPQIISVLDGNGVAVPYTGDLFTSGIRIEMIPGRDNLPLGNDTVIITCTGILRADVNPREVINNTAQITAYASTPTGPNFVTEPSLYEDTANITIASPQLDKRLINSTDPGTAGNNLTIGEIGTFQINISLPEGEIENLTVIEYLPQGLRYISYKLETSEFNGTLAPLDVTVNSNTVTFLFNGTTTVNPDNSNLTDRFSIIVKAVVENSSSNPHVPFIQRTNTVNLNWPYNPGDPLGASYNFNILQPLLNVTKTITPNIARGRQNVTIRFNVTNNGLSPAYSVYIWDLLNSTAFNWTTVTALTTPPEFTYSYNPLNGTVEYSGGTINPGNSLTFEFNVTLNENVRSNSTFNNTVNLTYESLGPSTDPRDDYRLYKTSANATLGTMGPRIYKTLYSTSEPDSTGNNVLIGEVVKYRIDITIPVGVTANVTVRDPVDSRYLSYIMGSARISRSSGNITSDAFTFTLSGLNNFEVITETGTNPLSFYLGNLTNTNPQGLNETIRILIDLVVKNNGNNTAGRSITNRAFLDYRNEIGAPLTTSSAHTLTVILPSPYVNKTANKTVDLEGGETVNFIITVGNTAGSNIAPLYDINITDILDPIFVNIRDVTATKSNTTINFTYTLIGNNFTAYIDRLLQGQTVNITITADLRNDTIHGSFINNTVLITATSLPGPYGTNNTTPGIPGTETGERTGEGGVNNLTANSTLNLYLKAPSIIKTFLNNSNSTYSPIGNILTQKLTLNIPVGRTESLKVTDVIPVGLEPFNFIYIIDPSMQVEYPTPTPLQTGNTWTINFGEVNATGAGLITVIYNITVKDIPGNINGAKLINNATLSYYNGTDTVTTPPSAASVTIVEPVIRIEKTGTTNLNPGELCTWTITVSHNATSTSDAYDLIIEDILPAGMTYNETISIPPGWTITSHSDRVTYRAPVLNRGDTVTIIFKARIDDDTSLAGKDLINTVNITYTSLPGDITGERIYNSSKTATIHVLGTDIEIDKNASNESPNYDDTIVYYIKVKNKGPDPAANVNVSDKLPAGLIYVTHLASRGIYDPVVGSWIIGNLNPLETVTLNITVRVNVTGTIVNDANVTSSTTDINTSNNNDSTTIRVPKASELSILKTVNIESPYNGQIITYTINVSNNGPDDALNVLVEDLLPSNLVFVSYVASKGTYNPVTGVWSVGSLSYLETATLTITARVNADGIIKNSANVTSENFDPDTSNNNSTVTINSISSVDLKVTKYVNNTRPLFGQLVMFTVTAENLGPSNASNVAVTDTLSPGLVFVSYVASKGTYNPVTGVWSVGSLSYLETATLTIQAYVNSTGNLFNLVIISGSEHDPVPANNIATVNLQSLPVADLSITKEASKTRIYNNEYLNFTLNVTNKGPNTANGVEVKDLIPGGFILVSTTASQGTYNDSTGKWYIGSLGVGERAILKLLVMAVESGSLTNNAEVNGSEVDPSPDDNSANATVTVDPAADVAVTKMVSNSTPNFGELVTFYVTVTNNGPDNATGVTVTDSLPVGLVYVSHVVSRGSFNPLTGVWLVGDLLPGSSATLNFTVLVNRTGDVVNRVLAVGEEFDPYPENNTAEVTVRVPAAAYLVIDKVVNATMV